MKRIFFLFLSLFICQGFAWAQQSSSSYHAIDPANLDLSVKPSVDFYMYANGNWIKNNPLPPSKSSWASFNELFDNNRKILKTVLEEAVQAHAAKGSDQQKIGDFFSAGMDSVQLNKLGFQPLKPYLDQVNRLATKAEVLKAFADFNKNGFASIYDFGVGIDDKNSGRYIPGFSQSGLGLPDKDYYFKKDSRTKVIRDAYVKHVSSIMQLLGKTKVEADKEAVLIQRIETDLANVSMDKVVMRDPYATYHKLSPAQFTALTPGINWSEQLAYLGVPKADSILVAQPDFFKHLATLLAKEPIDTWKVYLSWKLISSTASLLSEAFQQENFNFRGRILSGAKVQEKRWERITSLTDGVLGEVLGKEYVKKAFPPEAKARMLLLIGNLKEAFAERIKALDWMSAKTKEYALKKLKAITVKVGYPDHWKDYSTLDIVAGDYFGNVIRARQFEYQYSIDHYGKPVDRTTWSMSPPTVNAYYNPGFNEIVFPAGILQAPFFDFNADDAVNYGGIGSVIGHEMTHGFDDQGRLYDAEGNLKDWWTKEDAKKFKAKVNKVVTQFNAYTMLDSLHVNGKLTLGENLADLGGTMISYQAFKKTKQGQSKTKIDGFTPDQRFFIGFAQLWRGNFSPQNIALRIHTDPHSPAKWRVIGALSNNAHFYRAFGIKLGDPMYRVPNIRAQVW